MRGVPGIWEWTKEGSVRSAETSPVLPRQIIAKLNGSVLFLSTRCEEECSNLRVRMVDSVMEFTGKHCKMTDHDRRCYIYYSFPEEADLNNLTISRYRECSPY